MKTHVITVSRVFPATHKRKGQDTGFVLKILKGTDNCSKCEYCINDKCLNNTCKYHYFLKVHTIRANYNYWKKRIDEVQEGKAILSVRYWSGKPYNSKQKTICDLTKDDGVGIQKILFDDYLYSCLIEDKRFGDMWKLSQNDGLSDEDFEEWFKKYDFREPMAIIHFRKFRY